MQINKKKINKYLLAHLYINCALKNTILSKGSKKIFN